jgi:two-component system phosphate regulon response regulator PhoB
MSKKKILIVEDDRALAGVLEYNFGNAGYEVYCASDGMDGINQARSKQPDLIVLDLMIPVIDGIEVCRTLRGESATRETPILMLTAKSEEADQLIGFSVGADDYVVKPFSVRVLLERVKSLLRRQERITGPGADIMVSGAITVDRVKHRALVNDIMVDLTPSEFRLLDTLIRNPGRAFDRSELIDSALGADTLVLERTIDVHIRSLRKKLGSSSKVIQTVRGVGYRFREPDGSDLSSGDIA